MIYDTLSNIQRYKGIHCNLDTALEFLEKENLYELEVGRVNILGDKVYADIMTVNTRDVVNKEFEYHKKYLDIQLDIIGEEKIYIGYQNDLTTEKYDIDNDFGLITCQKETEFILGGDKFIICMLSEPHKPSIKISEKKTIRKCVVKVLID